MAFTSHTFFGRLLVGAACSALVLTLSADLGQIRARRTHAETVAATAGKVALETIDRSLPLDEQRRHVEETVNAVLAANGEDPQAWQLSLIISGTSLPPALAAVVSTDQSVPTSLLGYLSTDATRLHAEATVKVPARPLRVIARRPDDSVAGID